MTNFIDAWDRRTGQRLDYQIPDTWIPNGLAPHLSDTDPGVPGATDSLDAPAPDVPGDNPPPEPPTDVAAEPTQDPVTDPAQNLGEV